MSLPSQYLFQAPRENIETRIEQYQITPASGNSSHDSSTGEQTLRFEIPYSVVLNDDHTYLEADLQIVDLGGAVNPRFKNGGLAACIKDATFQFGGAATEKTSNGYNVFARQMIDSSADDAQLNSNWEEGMGTPAALLSWATDNRSYVHKLRLGFFNQKKLIPMWIGGEQPAILELRLASTKEACALDGGSIKYVMSNIRLTLETQRPEESYIRGVREGMKMGIQLNIKSYENFELPITSSSEALPIRSKHRSVRALLCAIRTSTNYNGTGDWEFSNADLESFQFNLAGQSYPNYYCKYGAQSIMEYKKSFGTY